MSSYVLLLYGNTLKTLALQKTNLLKNHYSNIWYIKNGTEKYI